MPMSDAPESAPGPPPAASRTSFEQLDTLVRVTTVPGWIYLTTLLAVCTTAVLFTVVYQVPTKVNGEGILLINKDRLSLVRARAIGRLIELRVKLGDRVSSGDIIGRISQDDLADSIREAESKLNDMRREDRDLTEFEDRERQRKEDAVAGVKKAVLQAQDNSLDKLKIAERIVISTNRLRDQRNLGDIDLLDARKKYHEIRDDIYKGRSRLAELELELTSAEIARHRLQLDRRLKIHQLETKLVLDHEKLKRNSQIVSPSTGEVAQVLSVRGELVHEGAPVVLLHYTPKEEVGTEDAGAAYESIVFVPAGEGKKINVNQRVELSPATVKREEYGFIWGKVVAVSELPATKRAMGAALEHPELVDSFLQRYAPGAVLRVHIKLDEAPPPAKTAEKAGLERHNDFVWSSSSGPRQYVKTGTMCQAAVVVDRRRLVSLILPWTKVLVGAD
jgi:HlyD family secretion protein